MKKSIYFSTDTAFIGVTTHQRQHNLKNIYIFNLQLVESGCRTHGHGRLHGRRGVQNKRMGQKKFLKIIPEFAHVDKLNLDIWQC